MAEAEFLVAAIPVFLSMLVPGVLLALPLLKNSKLHLFEKCMFGLMVGMVVPPFILVALSLVGIGYSFGLMLFVLGLATLAGLLLNFTAYAKGKLVFRVGAIKELFNADLNLEKKEDIKRAAVWLILLAIMLWAFWARMQSLSPIFYEFDPYYYMQSTKWVLTDGEIPAHDYTGWYPLGSSHRMAPLTNYIEAQWYSIHTRGGAFDRDLLTLVANTYPPLVGALLCFLVFIIAKEEWGRHYGLAAAAFAAVLPRLIMKFSAGSAELQPFGIFAIFFFAAAYSLMLRRKSRGLAILAGIAALTVITGTQYFIILTLVYGGYLGLQATFDYLRGKDLREFLTLNAYVLAGVFIASAALSVHLSQPFFILDKPMLLLAALAYGCGLQYVQGRIKGAEEKVYSLLGVAVICALLLLATGLGDRLITAITTAAGFATQTTPLFMTVAEESPTAGEFSGSFDLLGYAIAGDITLIHVTLFLAAFAFAYAAYRDSKSALLLALLIFPISWVGLNKSKYVLQLGFMLILALCAVFGELQALMERIFKEEKRAVKLSFMLIMLSITALVVLEPSIEDGKFGLRGSPVELYSASSGAQYWNQDGSPNCNELGMAGHGTAYYLYCSRMPDYWTEPMRWLREETPQETRILSWWDYGHWTNYFGERDTVTRNDHPHPEMDLMVADKFVFGPRDNNQSGEADMLQFMRDHKATHVLFDYDLIAKWGALNFLACVHNNETNMTYAKENGMGNSQCERNHDFERVIIPMQRSASDYCNSPYPEIQFVRARSTFGYSYCVAEEIQDGYQVPSFMVYEDNMSKQNAGYLVFPQLVDYGGRQQAVYTVLYPEEGYEDRKGRFYDSNFYKGFFLGKLEGFEVAYEYRENGQVMIRIFKPVE